MAGGSEEESCSLAAMVCDEDAMVGDRVYGEINMDGVVVQLRPDSVSRAYR
jgi:hypothetical protein